MNAIDRQMLEFCRDGFRPLKPLIGRIPSGTVYRHARRLRALGWLQKEGMLYRATNAGLRELEAITTQQPPDPLVALYPPLAQVPTAVHRALIALVFAAAAARHHEVRPDRHPFFVLSGATLLWKSSAGRFLCHALGLDPATHVVDCGIETGKSLAFRRDGTGAIVSRRALLDAPLVVLDEFLNADPAVRDALGILLSGRLVMPVENETLTVRPVPVVTLNPRPKDTLEGRLGLSAPLIRRAILVDLDAVSMPDLAAVGETAVEAARVHAPLELAEPGADARARHDAIVQLIRAMLVPAAQTRLDIEIVGTLVAGMTAFIPDLVPAIMYVAQALGLLAETLGWTRPGWGEAVARFGQEPSAAVARSALVVMPPAEPPGAAADPSPSVSLVVSPPPPRRRTTVPDLDLSEALRARLIWFAMETQQDLEDALTALLDAYLAWREADTTIETLRAILRLGDDLERTEIRMETLHEYLQTLAALQEEGCTFDDVPEALRLITGLQALPVAWDWQQAETALQAVAFVLEAGITVEDLQAFLAQHHQLTAIGFDAATALGVVDALTGAGAVGAQRDAVLEAMVAGAGRQVEIEALETQRRALETEVAEWTTRARETAERCADLQAETERLEQSVAQLRETMTHLQEERDRDAGGLAVVRALHAFLLGKTAEAESLWRTLEALFIWRRNGGRADDALGTNFTNTVRQKMLTFFQQLIREGLGQ